MLLFPPKTYSLAWRNYEWKGKQDHHICGNKEAVWWSHQENEKGWVSEIILSFWTSVTNNPISTISVGGQLWASMEIKASRKETGFSMVMFTHIYHILFWMYSEVQFPFYFRVQIWQSPNPHCHRCCFQGSRSVSYHIVDFYILKESILAFFNSSASFWVSPLAWRSSLCGRALAWQAQVLQRGKEDSWRCPDWWGMGLPVMQIYRGDEA